MSNPKLHPLLISNAIPCCEIQAKLIIKKIPVPKKKEFYHNTRQIIGGRTFYITRLDTDTIWHRQTQVASNLADIVPSHRTESRIFAE